MEAEPMMFCFGLFWFVDLKHQEKKNNNNKNQLPNTKHQIPNANHRHLVENVNFFLGWQQLTMLDDLLSHVHSDFDLPCCDGAVMVLWWC